MSDVQVRRPRCGKCSAGRCRECEHPRYSGGFTDDKGRPCCCFVTVHTTGEKP